MLKLFKRLLGIQAAEPQPPPRRRRSARKQPPREPGDPPPLPDVVEGNDETDWDLWQDSVDSQVAPLAPSSRNYPDTVPSQLDGLDPYHRVGKNRDS